MDTILTILQSDSMAFLIRQTLLFAVPLMIVALTYLAMVFGLTGLLHKLERRLAKGA